VPVALAVAIEPHPSARMQSSEPIDALNVLDPVERTLLIPLLARVWGRRWHCVQGPWDQSGEHVLARLSHEVPPWLPDPVTLCCIVWRTRQLVAEAQAHFARHPRSWGVNMGAGLSDYFQWLDNGVNHWVDIDRQRVMQLRSRCMPPHTRGTGLSVDLTEPGWWSRVAGCISARRQPLFVMLEGVLLYMRPSQAKQVLATLGEHAPAGTNLVFDVIPRWLVGWPVRMPLPVKEQPVFQWGLTSMQELETLHPRLQLQSATSSPLATMAWSWPQANPWQSCAPYAVVRLSVS
jgi:O-methyltransferase involved in polyketide biosynthesis